MITNDRNTSSRLSLPAIVGVVLFVGALVAIVLILLDRPQRACVPGQQIACACAGGTSGIQACQADGTRFDACACSTASAAGSPRSPTPPTSSTAIAIAGAPVLRCPAGMVPIPAGSFSMGSDIEYPKKGKDVGFPDREEYGWRPVHTVELSAYCIDKFEVTVRRFKECVDNKAGKKCEPPGLYSTETENNTWGVKGKEDHPVNMVSYEQAKDFCAYAGGRLPTEAEWEYAARGTDGREYPWGPGPNGKTLTCNDTLSAGADPAGKLAALFGEASSCFKGVHGTWQVNSAPAGVSPFNVFDMAGNVMEWVEDRFDVSFYRSSPRKDPRNPPKHIKTEWGVVRGGGWSHGGGDPNVAPGWNSKTFWREPMPYWDPEENKPARDAEIGFRCVALPDP